MIMKIKISCFIIGANASFFNSQAWWLLYLPIAPPTNDVNTVTCMPNYAFVTDDCLCVWRRKIDSGNVVIHHVGRNTVKIKTGRTDRLQSTQWFKLRINVISRSIITSWSKHNYRNLISYRITNITKTFLHSTVIVGPSLMSTVMPSSHHITFCGQNGHLCSSPDIR